jgi:hypothetical protein
MTRSHGSDESKVAISSDDGYQMNSEPASRIGERQPIQFDLRKIPAQLDPRSGCDPERMSRSRQALETEDEDE